ncbi:MAG: endonuclease [Flavobacteriales bacterium]
MFLPKLIFFLLAASLTTAVWGQYPSNIHNSDLRVWLKSNLYDGEFSDLGYSNAREEMFSYTDEVNGKIVCVYTDFEMNAVNSTFPNPINTEHIIPQSFFGSSSPMRSDLHNLRPTHQNANSARANFGFDEIPDNQADWYGISSGGAYLSTGSEPNPSADFSEGTDTAWEPQEDRKGDIARQVFYFYTVYPTQAGPISNLADVNTLYQWHLNDPADALELQRNNRVEQVQGNRNPYIDFEELVFDAWLWVEILGCTDDQATNFNPQANTNDGSCTYGTEGCTNPDFIEFNPEAVIEDGSCQELVVLGCRYPNALNFNPNVNKDDNGSCEFDEVGCLGDLNNDGAVTIGDLSGFLAAFGTPCP